MPASRPATRSRTLLPNPAVGGRFALVTGPGGLGQVAVHMLTALTGATVIATDMKADAMKRAQESEAVTVPGGPGQSDAIRAVTLGAASMPRSSSPGSPRRSRRGRRPWRRAAA
jgi:alcohol dehydrogenase, propanol-preferring